MQNKEKSNAHELIAGQSKEHDEHENRRRKISLNKRINEPVLHLCMVCWSFLWLSVNRKRLLLIQDNFHPWLQHLTVKTSHFHLVIVEEPCLFLLLFLFRFIKLSPSLFHFGRLCVASVYWVLFLPPLSWTNNRSFVSMALILD